MHGVDYAREKSIDGKEYYEGYLKKMEILKILIYCWLYSSIGNLGNRENLKEKKSGIPHPDIIKVKTVLH